MAEAFICDGIRTPIGRYGGALSSVRTDDLASLPLTALKERNPSVDWDALDDVILGCANQAGEDNRNVARMALLIASLPLTSGGLTVNRLCGSGISAVADGARSIKCGEAELVIAGGVESMSRAPFVLPKATTPFARQTELYDSTIGWRFVNPYLQKTIGTDGMPETAENLAQQFQISREDQDMFSLRSQQRSQVAIETGVLAQEIIPIAFPPQKKQKDPQNIHQDEHPRFHSALENLSRLKPLFGNDKTVTAGNSSGINDGAAALLIASEKAVEKYSLTPKARVISSAVAGVEPRIMGIGPVPATKKLLHQTGLKLSDMDLIELNEAFAAQSLAVMRELGLPDDAEHVNPNGGAIALGHPLGMSGARLIITATNELQRRKGRYALCSMCIGVGQGISMIIEKV